jgi:hypothetical protein
MLIVWAGTDGPIQGVVVRPTGIKGRYVHNEGFPCGVGLGQKRIVRPGEGTGSPLGHVMGTYGLLVDLC